MSDDADSVDLKEEYAKLLQECEDFRVSQAKHIGRVTENQKQINDLVQLFKRKAESKTPITAAEVHVLSLWVRTNTDGHAVSQRGLDVLLAIIVHLSLLTQVERKMDLRVPENIAKALQSWAAEREAAERAMREYIK